MQRWWYLKYPEHIVFPSKAYFRDWSGWSVARWIRTYASVGYRQPTVRALVGFLKAFARRRYTGLPSVGPDHVLVVLQR